MEITIRRVTTKLTKSLIAQMPVCDSLCVLQNCEVIGKFYNCHKDMIDMIIIKKDDCYYRLAGNWKKGDKTFFRKSGKGSQSWDFETTELCSMAWDAYKRIKHLAVHTYI